VYFIATAFVNTAYVVVHIQYIRNMFSRQVSLTRKFFDTQALYFSVGCECGAGEGWNRSVGLIM